MQRRRNQPGQRGGQGSPERSLDSLWPNYLKGGYFDDQGNLRPEYLSRERVLHLAKEIANARPYLTTHQIRRFFNHCRRIETKLKAGKATWEQVRAEFMRLDSVAADALGKKQPKIPRLFHDFIMRNVAAVKNKKDFLEGFMPHFEALVGFGQQHFKEERR